MCVCVCEKERERKREREEEERENVLLRFSQGPRVPGWVGAQLSKESQEATELHPAPSAGKGALCLAPPAEVSADEPRSQLIPCLQTHPPTHPTARSLPAPVASAPPHTAAPACPCLRDDPWPPHTGVGVRREPEAPMGQLQGWTQAQSVPDAGPVPSRQPPHAGQADAMPSRLQRKTLACPPRRRAADPGGRCGPVGIPAAAGHVCNQGGAAAAASKHTRHPKPGGRPKCGGPGSALTETLLQAPQGGTPLQPRGRSPVLPSLPSPLAAVTAASSLAGEGGLAQPLRAGCSSCREVLERRLSIHAHDLSSYPCFKLQAVKGQGDIRGSWCKPGAGSNVSPTSSHQICPTTLPRVYCQEPLSPRGQTPVVVTSYSQDAVT